MTNQMYQYRGINIFANKTVTTVLAFYTFRSCLARLLDVGIDVEVPVFGSRRKMNLQIT